MERLPYYKLLHIFSLLVLTAHTFMAFANPDAVNRKRALMITGLASLLMLVSGYGMLHLEQIPYTAGWVIVKFVCWLGVSSLTGIVYRRAQLRGVLSLVALGLLLLAAYMVTFRPF